MHPNKKRLRRSMMFLNCQKPGLIKDPYIYQPDSIMLDLEDAVAENQKDAARYSLFHALKEIDYHGVERGGAHQRPGYAPLEGGHPGLRCPAGPTRSGSRKPSRRRMCGPWRSMSWLRNGNLEGRRAAPF